MLKKGLKKEDEVYEIRDQKLIFRTILKNGFPRLRSLAIPYSLRIYSIFSCSFKNNIFRFSVFNNLGSDKYCYGFYVQNGATRPAENYALKWEKSIRKNNISIFLIPVLNFKKFCKYKTVYLLWLFCYTHTPFFH